MGHRRVKCPVPPSSHNSIAVFRILGHARHHSSAADCPTHRAGRAAQHGGKPRGAVIALDQPLDTMCRNTGKIPLISTREAGGGIDQLPGLAYQKMGDLRRQHRRSKILEADCCWGNTSLPRSCVARVALHQSRSASALAVESGTTKWTFRNGELMTGAEKGVRRSRNAHRGYRGIGQAGRRSEPGAPQWLVDR